ncbi:MAG: hypothetical protein LBQ54_03515 [Planctomycetaceae bacterium]|jgi:ABC-type nickel/cobalt efflux system permease component RcnA|nr:hypothetical protein [Planctomycetaceae bacterium]
MPLVFFLLYALYVGFVHAFEPDHLLAVSNIVSRRSRILPAVKDGLFWGLGHTSTIFLVGVLMVLCQVNIQREIFSYFEAAVGLMLMIVAVCRIYVFFRDERPDTPFHKHEHEHAGENEHVHAHIHFHESHLHKTSYGIGIVHGLAGSGALILLVMTQIPSAAGCLLYLMIFGLGSMIGMAISAGLFSIPFSRKFLLSGGVWRAALVLLPTLLCFAYGCYTIYTNLFTEEEADAISRVFFAGMI